MRRRTKRENNPSIGLRLREARERAGLSTRAAAEAIGLRSHSVIHDYETGVTRVPMPRLNDLARAYHVKQSDLLKSPGAPWTERKRRNYARPNMRFFISHATGAGMMDPREFLRMPVQGKPS